MIFKDFFIANLLLSATVKNFEDQLGFGTVMAKNSGTFFSGHGVYRLLKHTAVSPAVAVNYEANIPVELEIDHIQQF